MVGWLVGWLAGWLVGRLVGLWVVDSGCISKRGSPAEPFNEMIMERRFCKGSSLRWGMYIFCGNVYRLTTEMIWRENMPWYLSLVQNNCSIISLPT